MIKGTTQLNNVKLTVNIVVHFAIEAILLN